MGFILDKKTFDKSLKELMKENKIFAPVLMAGKGTFSDTDVVRYAQINSIDEVVFDVKSNFSPKEVILPITQTLFYFTEDSVIEPKVDGKGIIIFLRSCDIHAVKRTDEIYLRNGAVDTYYKMLRDKVKFILMECESSFENCFCVSMGTNKTDDYSMFVKLTEDNIYVNCIDEEFSELFKGGQETMMAPKFPIFNEVNVTVPKNLDQTVYGAEMWNEYNNRCISCGRCNMVCGTCTCFTMQDIFYKDNAKNGERRRVWASCHIDGFSNMAGGHEFRKQKSEKMRFKVMHKIYDFKKKFGYQMCVGCGRCDDVCPEYISFSNCINKLNNAMDEVK